jgi:cobalt-zinc-cadmium efflux system protein
MDLMGKEGSISSVYGRAFAIGIGLNLAYVAIEAFIGLRINSSALVADAGHNLTDVMGLTISWGAIALSRLKPNRQFTYGFRKTTILAATLNGILIAGAAVFIFLEALKKMKNPSEIPGHTMILVAGTGVIINAFTAFLFMRGVKHDLNIKGTFLHMASDAAVSAGVVAGGFVMMYTGKYWIDPALSFFITGMILYSSAGLLIDSFKLSVDAVPKGINIENVREFLKNIEGIEDVHDLHIWALSTTETALTAHLVVPPDFDNRRINELILQLKEKFSISHSTLQTECHDKQPSHALQRYYVQN